MNFYLFFIPFFSHLRTRTGPEWGGAGGLDTPGKSQVIYVYLENKQLDPALEKVGPPPPGKCWTSCPETLELYSFLYNQLLDFL